MEIIFGRENAEKLRDKYTVLDLEKIAAGDGTEFEVFCLIPAEKIALTDLPTLKHWVKLHDDFITGYKDKKFKYCKDAIEHLKGKFGGEVDTFYEEILRRIDSVE